LVHAHGQGVIHRDLKSANVMVTSSGRVKILDFGLARPVRDQDLIDVSRRETAFETGGAIAGTLPCMAPETQRGEAADARTDIWALGVVLCELATGARPFTGRTPFELTSGILREPVPALPARLPAGLRIIIQRCLAQGTGSAVSTRGGDPCGARNDGIVSVGSGSRSSLAESIHGVVVHATKIRRRCRGAHARVGGYRGLLVPPDPAAAYNCQSIRQQLVEPRDRRVLWSDEYQGQRQHYLELVRQAADGLRRALRPGASNVSRTGPGTESVNSEAELALRRGTYSKDRYNKLRQSSDFDVALASFTRALDLDPTLADARSGNRLALRH
jgi:serine/threonine protein kinase